MPEMPNRAKLAELFQRAAPTQQEFADKLTKRAGVQVSQQLVLSWLKRERVPAKWVPLVVSISEGKTGPEEIRPDIYGGL